MPELELRKTDVLRLSAAIDSARDTPCSLQFGYALAKTRRLIESEVDAVIEVQQAFEKRRRDLAEQYAETDAAGKPVFDARGNYVIKPSARRQHLEAVEALQKEMDALLKSPTKVNVHQVPWTCVPQLTIGQFDGLDPLFIGEPPAPAA